MGILFIPGVKDTEDGEMVVYTVYDLDTYGNEKDNMLISKIIP